MSATPQPTEPTWSWVHGHSGVIQSPYGFLVERLGYYLRLKADHEAEAWVHYAVPTLAPTADASVQFVAVKFRTWAGGRLSGVHVWDGATQLVGLEDLDESSQFGSQSEANEPNRESFGLFTSPVPSNHLECGVGVSLLLAGRNRLDAIAIVGVGVDIR